MRLICYDCHNWRNKFGMNIMKAGKIVGWVCFKCSRKREVRGMKTGQGVGWRVNWRRFYNNLVQQAAREEK